MQVGVGFSTAHNPFDAGIYAVHEALQYTEEPNLTFLFCTDNYDQSALFHTVKNQIGRSMLVGACVPGIISREGVHRQGVGVLTIKGLEIQAVTALGHITSDSYNSGFQTGNCLKESGLKDGTIFVFPDGFAANMSHLLRGLYNALGSEFNYIGGGTGDNLRFHKSYQFWDQGFGSNHIAAALVKGIDFYAESGHGWKPIGEPMVVTKAEGKIVYELDGYPAFDRYSEVLGGIDRESFAEYGMKYPLSIPSFSGDYLIRDPINVRRDNSIEFVTEVPLNTVVTLMEGSIESLIDTARTVAALSAKKAPVIRVGMVFDCISRYLLMGDDFKREIDGVLGVLPREAAFIGVLTFGEVFNRLSVPLFYNKTIVVAVG
ncbi:MAG: FIST N-terminal domain-containing protein [Bacillota bacterium]